AACGGVVEVELLELLHAGEPLRHRREVGEQTTEPALVHVRLADARRLLGEHLLCLLLRADEEDRAAVGHGLLDELVRLVDVGERLLEVDDVDARALREDEALDLRVPAAGLVPEVDAAVEQLADRDDGHGRSPSLALTRLLRLIRAGGSGMPGARHTPAPEPARRPLGVDATPANTRFATLWARGVTPTSGVRDQVYQPAASVRLSAEPRRRGGERERKSIGIVAILLACPGWVRSLRVVCASLPTPPQTASDAQLEESHATTQYRLANLRRHRHRGRRPS